MAMIPKIIHYCWFGHNPKPKLAEKCIKSWEKYCIDYELMEWNEDNYDLSKAPLFVRQAYEERKWAFVSDYVRLWVVFNYGGIYLDTDVEVIRPLDDLLNYSAYFGFESSGYVNTGVGFGAFKECDIIGEMMREYDNIPFIFENGEFNTVACPIRNTDVLLRHGLSQNDSDQILEGNIAVFSSDAFSPVNNKAGELTVKKNTYSIHWYAASWYAEEERKKQEKNIRTMVYRHYLRIPNRIGRKILGDERYERLKELIKAK